MSQLVDGKGKRASCRSSLVWKQRQQAARRLALRRRPEQPAVRGRRRGRSSSFDVARGARRRCSSSSATSARLRSRARERRVRTGCSSPTQLQAPRVARSRPKRAGRKSDLRVLSQARIPACRRRRRRHRRRRRYPPYLPRQLLVFGRGYLPNARRDRSCRWAQRAGAVLCAMPARTSSRRVRGAPRARGGARRFPAATRKRRHFAFNWGVQKAARAATSSYSVGLYDLRACPGK